MLSVYLKLKESYLMKFALNFIHQGFKLMPFPSGNVSLRILIQSTTHHIKFANEQIEVRAPKTTRKQAPNLPSFKKAQHSWAQHIKQEPIAKKRPRNSFAKPYHL